MIENLSLYLIDIKKYRPCIHCLRGTRIFTVNLDFYSDPQIQNDAETLTQLIKVINNYNQQDINSQQPR